MADVKVGVVLKHRNSRKTRHAYDNFGNYYAYHFEAETKETKKEETKKEETKKERVTSMSLIIDFEEKKVCFRIGKILNQLTLQSDQINYASATVLVDGGFLQIESYSVGAGKQKSFCPPPLPKLSKKSLFEKFGLICYQRPSPLKLAFVHNEYKIIESTSSSPPKPWYSPRAGSVCFQRNETKPHLYVHAVTEEFEIPMSAEDCDIMYYYSRRSKMMIHENAKLSGLACSGGGIRSAAFQAGALYGLANKSKLLEMDYMSSVSGGGYTCSAFATQFDKSVSNEYPEDYLYSHGDLKTKAQATRDQMLRNSPYINIFWAAYYVFCGGFLKFSMAFAFAYFAAPLVSWLLSTFGSNWCEEPTLKLFEIVRNMIFGVISVGHGYVSVFFLAIIWFKILLKWSGCGGGTTSSIYWLYISSLLRVLFRIAFLVSSIVAFASLPAMDPKCTQVSNAKNFTWIESCLLSWILPHFEAFLISFICWLFISIVWSEKTGLPLSLRLLISLIAYFVIYRSIIHFFVTTALSELCPQKYPSFLSPWFAMLIFIGNWLIRQTDRDASFAGEYYRECLKNSFYRNSQDLFLRELSMAGPYLLINTTATSGPKFTPPKNPSPRTKQLAARFGIGTKDEKPWEWQSFVFTRDRMGSAEIGFRAYEIESRRHWLTCNSDVRLSEAMATSGAAVSLNMGNYKIDMSGNLLVGLLAFDMGGWFHFHIYSKINFRWFYLSLLLTAILPLLALVLAYSLPRPSISMFAVIWALCLLLIVYLLTLFEGQRISNFLDTFIFPNYILRSLYNLMGGNRPPTSKDSSLSYIYLSDGGHFENLGAYELLRRRCASIFCFDAGDDFALQDKKQSLNGLYDLLKCALQTGLIIDYHFKGNPEYQSVSNLAYFKAHPTSLSKARVLHLRLIYPPWNVGIQHCEFWYAKLTLTGSEKRQELHLFKLGKENSFPFHSTGKQDLDSHSVTMYAELGEIVAHQLVYEAFDNDSSSDLGTYSELSH